MEERAVLSYTAFVLSVARVVASVPGFDSVDSEHADFLAVARYHDSVARTQVSVHVKIAVSQRPPNRYGQISLRYRANCSDSLVKVNFVLAEGKWNNRGPDLRRPTKLQNSPMRHEMIRKRMKIQANH
jgi:hypothetical protein